MGLLNAGNCGCPAEPPMWSTLPPPFTVPSHVANLRRKLNAKSRFEAVMTATRLGILSLGER